MFLRFGKSLLLNWFYLSHWFDWFNARYQVSVFRFQPCQFRQLLFVFCYLTPDTRNLNPYEASGQQPEGALL
jgi:hypothetical protein